MRLCSGDFPRKAEENPGKFKINVRGYPRIHGIVDRVMMIDIKHVFEI